MTERAAHANAAYSLDVFLNSQMYFWENTHEVFFFLKILFIYFQSEGKGGRKRGRETSMCGCLLHSPNRGPGLQPSHVPRLGIEPVTIWFTGWHSIHWATPARAPGLFLKRPSYIPACCVSSFCLLWENDILKMTCSHNHFRLINFTHHPHHPHSMKSCQCCFV